MEKTSVSIEQLTEALLFIGGNFVVILIKMTYSPILDTHQYAFLFGNANNIPIFKAI